MVYIHYTCLVGCPETSFMAVASGRAGRVLARPLFCRLSVHVRTLNSLGLHVKSYVCNTRWLLDHANAIFISTDSYHEVIEHTEYTLGELHTDNTESFHTKLVLTPTNIPTKQHN